ncbi:hypothetical protein [Streptomyces diastatochromogenes]|uniref:hypothetical protein n=1 Tax=Streptomyces diastatochromogenes TaxID=42236 RepID=UPI0036C98779
MRRAGIDPPDRFTNALPQPAHLIAYGNLPDPLDEPAHAHTDLEAHPNQGRIVPPHLPQTARLRPAAPP